MPNYDVWVVSNKTAATLKSMHLYIEKSGADDEDRTRDPDLGKVVLYR